MREVQTVTVVSLLVVYVEHCKLFTINDANKVNNKARLECHVGPTSAHK